MIQLVIDHDTGTVLLDGNEVRTSEQEYLLITYMAMNSMRASGGKELRENAYGHGSKVDVQNHLTKLRRKFDAAVPNANGIIVTAIGGGYFLNMDMAHVHIIDDQNGEPVPLPMSGTSNTGQPRRPIFPNPAEKRHSRPRAQMKDHGIEDRRIDHLMIERDEVPRRKSDRPSMPSMA